MTEPRAGGVCFAEQPNPSGSGYCMCFEKDGHDGPHRCCGGSTGDVHEWEDA